LEGRKTQQAQREEKHMDIGRQHASESNWEQSQQRRNSIGLFPLLCCLFLWSCLANFLWLGLRWIWYNYGWTCCCETLFHVNINIVLFNSIVLNAFYILITYNLNQWDCMITDHSLQPRPNWKCSTKQG